MGLVISFFRSRQLERIDYADLILYFTKELNCSVVSTDEEVKITFHDDIFDYDYDFLITKRSRVNNLALLNPEYVNIRFLIDLPIVLPEQTSRQIILVLDKICKKFQFVVFYDGLNDIQPLNLVALMKHMSEIKETYLLNNVTDDLYYLDSSVITHIANYHQSLSFLKEELGEDVELNKYQMLTNNVNKKVFLAVPWENGKPTVFPPHLDYVIVNDHGVEQFLSAELFLKKLGRATTELKDYIPNVSLRYLGKKHTSKAQRVIKRLSKYFEHDLVFSHVYITNIVEK